MTVILYVLYLAPYFLVNQNQVSDTVRSVRLSLSGFTRRTTLAALAGAFGYTLVLLATAYWAYLNTQQRSQ